LKVGGLIESILSQNITHDAESLKAALWDVCAQSFSNTETSKIRALYKALKKSAPQSDAKTESAAPNDESKPAARSHAEAFADNPYYLSPQPLQ
jgi:hypothetical protein